MVVVLFRLDGILCLGGFLDGRGTWDFSFPATQAEANASRQRQVDFDVATDRYEERYKSNQQHRNDKKTDRQHKGGHLTFRQAPNSPYPTSHVHLLYHQVTLPVNILRCSSFSAPQFEVDTSGERQIDFDIAVDGDECRHKSERQHRDNEAKDCDQKIPHCYPSGEEHL